MSDVLPWRTDRDQPEVPPGWDAVDVSSLKGTVMIIGGSDTGKSTLADHLTLRLREEGFQAGLIDGDPGQSRVGPPTCLGLITTGPETEDQPVRLGFVGSTTPKGHMLPLLVEAHQLQQAARESGADVILYDTTGLIDRGQGGLHLKWSKIRLLQPSTVLAIQREDELETFLRPLRRTPRLRLLELGAAPAARRRSQQERLEYRATRYREYFSEAKVNSINLRDLAVFPDLRFREHQIFALENARGQVQAIGLIEAIDRPSQRLAIRTPLVSLQGVECLRLGDILLDPKTYHDRQLPLMG